MREPFVLIVSATREQAVQLLKTVRDQLQHNRRLIADFPETCYPPGAKPAPKPWRDHLIVLRNGVCVRALGAHQQIRGMKHGRHRPSLIVADDLESHEHVVSAEQREKLRAWFEGALLKAGTPQTNVVVVGTILHYDALLANLIEPAEGRAAGWVGRKYRAVEAPAEREDLWQKWEQVYTGNTTYEDESGEAAAQRFFEANEAAMLAGTKVLWPELEDYPTLMATRCREGWLAFQAEKQNEPVDAETCVFSMHELRFWDDHYADVGALQRAIGSHARYFGACDPSLSRHGGRGDYAAIVILLQDTRDNSVYVLDADLARRKPHETCDRILRYAEMYDFHEFTVESNQCQEMMAEDLRRRADRLGLHLPIRKLNNTADKKGRIESIEPYVSQGRVHFCRRHRLLLDQLRQFPMAAHDDGPDALAMAVESALRRRATVQVVKLRGF